MQTTLTPALKSPLLSCVENPLAGSEFCLINFAHKVGWARVEVCLPEEHRGASALLHLAGQRVLVRTLLAGPEASEAQTSELFTTLLHEMRMAPFLEQYAVMVGFTANQTQGFKALLAQVKTQRLHAGSLSDFQLWLPARLGALARLCVSGPVRGLTEHLLCATFKEFPEKIITKGETYENSKIKSSFALGQLGCDAILTLFASTRGPAKVHDVAGDKLWQSRDVDALIWGHNDNKEPLKVEVKTESYTSGRLAYEWTSNLRAGTPGWMKYSHADVLISVLWPTGDVFIQDFRLVKAWLEANPRKIKPLRGTAPGQTYFSEFYPGSIDLMLEDIQEAVHLNLHDWLPGLCPAPTHKSLLPGRHSARTLKPNKLKI